MSNIKSIKPFAINCKNLTEDEVKSIVSKAVQAGAVLQDRVAESCTEAKAANTAYNYNTCPYWGVNVNGKTYTTNAIRLFGEGTVLISFDELDEFLGLKVDPYEELRQAAEEGEIIEVGHTGEWFATDSRPPKFTLAVDCYRIKPEQDCKVDPDLFTSILNKGFNSSLRTTPKAKTSALELVQKSLPKNIELIISSDSLIVIDEGSNEYKVGNEKGLKALLKAFEVLNKFGE